MSRVETPMGSGNWVESGYCVGVAAEPEVVGVHEEHHSCRSGCSHADGTWSNCDPACAAASPEPVPDRVYGSSEPPFCDRHYPHVESPPGSGNWINTGPDCFEDTDGDAMWLLADASAVCAARPGCELVPGPTISDARGPRCDPQCQPQDIIDQCLCARDDSAEPSTTCSVPNGCGDCSAQECPFAEGCVGDSANGCVCGTDRYVKDVCIGGIVMSEFYDSVDTCRAGASGPGRMGAVVKDGGRQLDNEDGYRCDHNGDHNGVTSYRKRRSCDGVAEGGAPMTVTYSDPSCSAGSVTGSEPAMEESWMSSVYSCGCMPQEGLVSSDGDSYGPQFDCPSQEWYALDCANGAVDAPIFGDAFCSAPSSTGAQLPASEIVWGASIHTSGVPYGECLNFHHENIGYVSSPTK